MDADGPPVGSIVWTAYGLMSGHRRRDAAKMAAVHRSTAYTWLWERLLQVVCVFMFVLLYCLASCATSLYNTRNELGEEDVVTVYRFEPTQFHNTFGPHAAVLRIADGDSVETTTLDAHGYDAGGELVGEAPNPQTGPFYVEGTEPGDAVAVTIEVATPNRDTGWTYAPVASHVVDAEFVPELPVRERMTWALDLVRRTARLAEPAPGLAGLVLPLAPMLGCLGVAPAHGQAIWTATSGPHGGNMDYRGLVAGATVTFPVFVAGALIHLGDGHAVQGDGEIVGTGIETSFDVRFSVRVLKGKEIGWPRGEDADYLFTMGNARPLDQALQHATTEMLRWLAEDYGLSFGAGSTLLGQVVRYEVGNVFDPAYTMVCKVPKAVLGSR